MTEDELERRRAFHESGHVCAALQFSVPVISATISDNRSFMHRGGWRAPADLGIECMTVLCLCGPAAEREYVGPITDDSDRTDIAMAREILSRQYDALQIGFHLNRARDSARALVTTPWARHVIPLIAGALLKRGRLNGSEILELSRQ
jgi:hypothetical protein